MVDYFKKKIYQNKQYIKFVISGGTALAAELVLIALLTEIFHLWYVVSSGIAITMGFGISFYLQKFWTFRHDCVKKIYKEMLLYLVVAVIGIIVNVWGIKFLVETFRSYYSFPLDYVFAQAFMGFCLGIGNFVFYKFIIFVKEKKHIIDDCINKN